MAAWIDLSRCGEKALSVTNLDNLVVGNLAVCAASEIHYRYQETDTGGKIVIDTSNPKALKAVHEFLRFQIAEHKTGDPMKPAGDDLKRQ